jgi:hypoxanthine phosphoribosyltransferase
LEATGTPREKHDSTAEMSAKLFITAQELLEDSFRLGARVLASGFRPTFIVAIWRGGAPIGTAVQEFLQYFGIQTDHIAIRTSSYQGIDGRSSTVRIHGTSYLIKNIEHDDRLLIVDDVFDTGHTIRALIEHLREKARRNTPQEIRVAVPYYKPTRNQTDLVPDYYLHETERWIKFPYSIEGLTVEEIRLHRPEIYEIFGNVLPDGAE